MGSAPSETKTRIPSPDGSKTGWEHPHERRLQGDPAGPCLSHPGSKGQASDEPGCGDTQASPGPERHGLFVRLVLLLASRASCKAWLPEWQPHHEPAEQLCTEWAAADEEPLPGPPMPCFPIPASRPCFSVPAGAEEQCQVALVQCVILRQ